MKLRQKTLLIINATLFGLIGLLYTTSSAIFVSSIQQAEENEAQQTVKGVLSLLTQTQENFRDRYIDWSAWDDTYAFIQDRNQNYLQMILPKPEELRQVPGLDIAGFMQPTDEVGGDYYDVLQNNGWVKIGIGDVTGHGLESGVLMLMTQTAVRTLLENQETDSTKFLNTLNQVIYKNTRRMNCYKNLTLALLDYQAGCIRLSGQHEEITEVRLQSGDGMVLYTDGITEAKNPQRQQYGLERLCQVVSQNWHQSVEGVRQAVTEDVQRHIGQQKIRDDVTLLVLKQQ